MKDTHSQIQSLNSITETESESSHKHCSQWVAKDEGVTATVPHFHSQFEFQFECGSRVTYGLVTHWLWVWVRTVTVVEETHTLVWLNDWQSLNKSLTCICYVVYHGVYQSIIINMKFLSAVWAFFQKLKE